MVSVSTAEGCGGGASGGGGKGEGGGGSGAGLGAVAYDVQVAAGSVCAKTWRASVAFASASLASSSGGK